MTPYQQIFQSALDRINGFWIPGSDFSRLAPIESRIEAAWLQAKPMAIFKTLCNQYVMEARKCGQ
jgi:hypothetical protein